MAFMDTPLARAASAPRPSPCGPGMLTQGALVRLGETRFDFDLIEHCAESPQLSIARALGS